ncbi:MAG TPA: hypothetical protein VFY39_03375, partial [Gammaproteobacteria bacterium]|nr:hypothetical protein [Gammaproteobacteria bacterium]
MEDAGRLVRKLDRQRSRLPCTERFGMKVLLANKFFYRKGGSEAVMFMERDFLRDAGVEIVDFSMRDPRNLPSSYAEAFVARQTYGENRRRRPLHRL